MRHKASVMEPVGKSQGLHAALAQPLKAVLLDLGAGLVSRFAHSSCLPPPPLPLQLGLELDGVLTACIQPAFAVSSANQPDGQCSHPA